MQSPLSSYLIWSSQDPVRSSTQFPGHRQGRGAGLAQKSPRTSECWVLSPKVPPLPSSILRPSQSLGVTETWLLWEESRGRGSESRGGRADPEELCRAHISGHPHLSGVPPPAGVAGCAEPSEQPREEAGWEAAWRRGESTGFAGIQTWVHLAA